MTGFKRIKYTCLAALCLLAQGWAAPGRGADSDGDGLLDELDSLPSLATVPVHWSVQSLTLRWAGLAENSAATGGSWSAVASLPIASTRARSDAPGTRRGAGATASPLDWIAGDPAQGNGLLMLGTFGTGTMLWEEQQRIRAQAFARNPAGAGRAVIMSFEIFFRNFSAGDWMFKDLAVPVTSATGRRLAEARPANPAIAAQGVVLPGQRPLAVYSLEFEAMVPAAKTGALFDALQRGSPSFDFERAGGEVFSVEMPEGSSITDWLGGILKRTAAVRVAGRDGQILCWRVARKFEGVPQTAGAWAETVDGLARATYGRPFLLEAEGFLTSLCGWDTGAWDFWWHASPGRSAADWSDIRLRKDIDFTLADTPPVLKRRDTERLQAIVGDPVIDGLRGRHAWLADDFEAALAAYRRAADAGYPAGLHWLGYCHASGKGVPRDEAQAVRHYTAAARADYAPAQTGLGGSLLHGKGIVRDREAAFAWLGRAAAQGHPEGAAVHALCLTRGVGVAADPEKGMANTRRAAWLGSPVAQFGLGLMLTEAGDAEGVDWLRCAASAGEVRAQLHLARSLDEGRLVRRDGREALKWYALAAGQGEVEAQLAMGRARRNGAGGMRRNLGEAAEWFRKAADQGNDEARTWWGMMLLDGTGVARDGEAGLALIRRAAENGFAQAQYLLGLCLYSGAGGVPEDPAEAFKWFEAAAAQKVLPARIFVGFCYYQGRGVAEDRAAAFRNFEQAAAEGSAIGQIWLAHCYALGEGVEANGGLARDWAMKAWQQGHPGGRLMLRRIPQ